MIHALTLFGEVAFCAFLIFLCKKHFKDTIGKLATPILAAIFIVCLFLSNSWVQKMPVCYDEVGIVALDQKNEQSKGNEISVLGIEMRGRKMEFPEISEGKWFFTTEDKYMWRPESDPRQPEGTTKSIVLKVPVGTERALLFKDSNWGGLAQVELLNQKDVVDTYTTSALKLENSGILKQLLQAICRFIVFGLIMCAFAFLMYILCRASQSDNQKLKNKTLYASIALSFFAISASYLESQEFWLDEIFQVGFSGTGKNLFETLMVTETTPPLFRLIANIWYNIVPYGEEWLLLLPTLFCAGFVYTVGLLGEEIGGKYVGFASSLLAAVSTALLNNGVREFRSNALLTLLSCVFMLYYVKRLKTGEYTKTFTVVMILLAYTHYFGVFLCGAAFILDIYYFCCKKRKIKDFIPYLIAVVLYIPWVFRLIDLGHMKYEVAWMNQPTLKTVYNLMIFLCGEALFVVLLAVGIISVLFNKKQSEKSFDARFSLVFILFVMIACLYAYGTFIRPQATLWAQRYFMNILSCAIVITAFGLVQVGRFLVAACERILPNLKSVELAKRTICVLLSVFLLFSNMPKISAGYTPSSGQDYKGAAETIYSHVDAYKDDSIVVFLCQDYVVDGWYEYYMTMQGKRDDVNYASFAKIPTDPEAAEEFFEPYETIYLCYLQEYDCPTFTEQMKEHYKLVENDRSTCVRVYKRID